MSGIKIATFADFHLGVTTYGTTDAKTGLNSRVLNALNSLDKMIEYCINNDIEYIIFAGDMYKNNLPSPTLQRELNVRIKYAAKKGIEIYLMAGNHDVSPTETAKCPMDPFNTLEVNNIYHSRFESIQYIDDDLRVLMLPTYTTEDEIKNILNKYNDGIKTIVVGHLTVLGAKLNDWLLETNEDAISTTVFEQNNIMAVVLGHLHKHQILNTKPLTYYTGSLQRIDFTEEFQKKGFVVLDVDTFKNSVEYEFIEIESQKFFTIHENLKDTSDEMDYILNILDINKDKIKNSIFRLTMELNKSNNINDDILVKHIHDLGVQQIAAINKNVDRNESIRNSNITEMITEEEALEMYFQDHEDKEDIINQGLEMINYLKNNNKI